MPIGEKMYFAGEYRKYENSIAPNKELIIFPDRPFWFIATAGCKNILDSLSKKTEDELMTLSENEQTILEFLVTNNLVYFGEENEIDNSFPSQDVYPILAVWVNIDSACNLNCKHCFLGSKKATAKQELLTPNDYRNFVNDLREISGERAIKIDITGGEPLMRTDFIEIMDAFNIDGVQLNVITNALLLTDHIIAYLSKLDDIEVTISLDGVNKEEHEFIRGANTYDVTIQNILKCTKAGIPTTLTMTVHKGNQDSIIRYFTFAEELGASHVNLSFLNDFGNAPVFGLESPDEAELTKKVLLAATINDAVYSRLMDTSMGQLIDTLLLPIRTDCCGSGINNCSIGANGNIYPCPSFQTEEFVAGNIKSKSIKEIWMSKNSFAAHRKVDITTMNPTCSACDVRFFCGGGCRAQAYFTNQNEIYARSQKCAEYRKTILETMWLIDKYPKLGELHTSAGVAFRAKC